MAACERRWPAALTSLNSTPQLSAPNSKEIFKSLTIKCSTVIYEIALIIYRNISVSCINW